MSSLANIKGFGSSLIGGVAKSDPYSFSIDDDKKDDRMTTKSTLNKKSDMNNSSINK